MLSLILGLKGDKRNENAERLGNLKQNDGFGIFTYKVTGHKKISKKLKKYLTTE